MRLNEKKYVGQKHGKLTILRVYRENGETMCDCQCDCGNAKKTYASKVIHGEISSCGCMRGNKKHGKQGTRLYRIWQAMKIRCRNPNAANYKYYGGKGVSYCTDWEAFEPFEKWAMAHGYADDLSIDRIDVNGNYEPSNCRWATWKEQCNNKTSNIIIEHGSEKYSLKEFCYTFGLSYSAILTSLRRGRTTLQDIANKAPIGMSLNTYQDLAMATCMPSCENFSYMFYNLVGEVGELASKVAKAIRKGKASIYYNQLITESGSDAMSEQEIHDLKAECGDVAWQLAGLCKVMGWTLEEVCQENLDKLASRKERGVIDGSGDNR